MKWEAPDEPFVTLIFMLPSCASRRTSLFARVPPAAKLSLLVAGGRGRSPPNTTRNPAAPGPATVRFPARPLAAEGTPQRPVTPHARPPPGPRLPHAPAPPT